MDASSPKVAPAPAQAVVARRRRALQLLRRGVLVVAIVGLVYLYKRYELLGIPEGQCSPMLGIEPGMTLLLDRRPVDEHLYLGDLVIYELPDGKVSYARISRPPGTEPGTRRIEAGFWLLGDNPDCPLPDSRSEGVFPLESISARVLFPLRF